MTKNDLIKEYNLTDAYYMTANDKAKVLMDWDKFLRNGCKFVDFTDRLYKHITLYCEFIAHYDRVGFHATYFLKPEMTVKFIKQFDPDGDGMSIEYHMTCWLNDKENEDINEAMRKIMGKYSKHLIENALNWDKELDCREIERLMKKHGISTYTIKS